MFKFKLYLFFFFGKNIAKVMINPSYQKTFDFRLSVSGGHLPKVVSARCSKDATFPFVVKYLIGRYLETM